MGDAIWAAADQRARGFLLGATSGRTTLGGEGLQHQYGTSHLVAATIPNCKAYDPAFAGEMAVNRFATARQLMGYLGLVPSEHSSGSSVRRGSITKLATPMRGAC